MATPTIADYLKYANHPDGGRKAKGVSFGLIPSQATMLRRPRIQLVGMPMHLVQRGINRELCCFAEEDYHAEEVGCRRESQPW